MSALRWPVYTSEEILEALRLALATSPLAQPPEANYRCLVQPGEDARDAECEAPVAC